VVGAEGRAVSERLCGRREPSLALGVGGDLFVVRRASLGELLAQRGVRRGEAARLVEPRLRVADR
jgi:hypothetical protein